jgi:outer membrane receptor protein involved in Fe transport
MFRLANCSPSSFYLVRFTIFIFLLSCFAIVSFGQVNGSYEITGVVVDSASKQPIEYASVAVYKKKDSLLVSGSISNLNGEFVIKGVPAGKYILKSNFIGYKTGKRPVDIVNASVNMDHPIELSITSLNLTEVQITDKQNAKQVSIEKTKIDISQNISAISGNITDVLKSQSNITIDAEDNVYLRGSNKILLLIDGRPTTVSSLNSIPSSSVENIEIVTNPDAKYDAEGTGGIINIITKRKMIEGFSGSATINYGFLTRINSGLNLNYSKSIWDVGFSYSGRYEKAIINSILERELILQQVQVNQDIHSTQVSPTHNASLSLSVKPGKKNIVSAGIKFIQNNLHNTQEISGQQTNDTLPATEFKRRNEVAWNRTSLEGSLSYKRVIVRNKHEISVDAFYSQTKGSRPADYYIDDQFQQKSDAGGKPTNISLQADYIKTLFKKGRMEAGLKAFSRWNNFNAHFYDWDSISSDWILNPGYSNDLELKEFIYSGYLMYSDTLFRKLYYKLGARIEYSTSDLYQNSTSDSISEQYIFPFPYLLLKYGINRVNSVALSINRRVTRPTMGQLNPFIIVVDQITFETGNKYLRPEILDKVEFNYSLIKERFQLRSNLYLSMAKDFITQVTILTPSDDLVVTYANGTRQSKTGIDVDATLKFGKVFMINPGLSAFYSLSSGEYLGADLNSEGFAWTGNIKFVVKPDSRTDIQLFLNYNSPVELPQFRLQEIYYADFGVKRSFLKNKLSIGLTVTDIFNTRNWIISSNNLIYDLYNKSKSATRIVWLGITYNLNSFKFKQTQKGDGNENENGLIKLGH